MLLYPPKALRRQGRLRLRRSSLGPKNVGRAFSIRDTPSIRGVDPRVGDATHQSPLCSRSGCMAMNPTPSSSASWAIWSSAFLSWEALRRRYLHRLARLLLVEPSGLPGGSLWARFANRSIMGGAGST
jgi:hypothetical protein